MFLFLERGLTHLQTTKWKEADYLAGETPFQHPEMFAGQSTRNGARGMPPETSSSLLSLCGGTTRNWRTTNGAAWASTNWARSAVILGFAESVVKVIVGIVVGSSRQVALNSKLAAMAFLNVTQAPDPTKVMEMLAALGPEAQEAVMQKAEELQQNGMFGAASSPDDLRKRFRKQRQQYIKTYSGPRNLNSFNLGLRHCHDVKPSQRSRSTALVPMMVKELTLGTTHRGRVLEGRTSGNCVVVFEQKSGHVLFGCFPAPEGKP